MSSIASRWRGEIDTTFCNKISQLLVKMISKHYHIVGTVPKSNRKIDTLDMGAYFCGF